MRILGVGDNVVDRYHDLGLMFPGGNALNVAVAARRAGAEAAYLGALGTDEAGRLVLAGLRAEGIERARLRVVEGPNAFADVEVVAGDRVFVGSDDGVSRFRLDDADLAYASTFDLVHTGDCSAIEDQVEALGGRTRVSFDFSTNRESAYLEPLLPHVEIACFSASDLDEPKTNDLLVHAVERGARLALATRGREPTLLSDGRRIWRQAVIPGDPVDTLGAGDSFIGRFLVGVLAGESPEVTLRAAAEAAATTCSSYGAFGRGWPFTPTPVDEAASAAS